MHYMKMHGAGNDFVLLDNRDGQLREEQYAALARRLCARRVSIGADGLMVVERPRAHGDIAMVFLNADGSRGEMCGNGARCICRYAYDHGLAGDDQRIETAAGPVTGHRLAADRYRVRLNDPSVIRPHVELCVQGRRLDCFYIELGNPGIPHAVLHWEDWDRLGRRELFDTGALVRAHSAFPRGANVTFWRHAGPNRVKAITFERGVEDFTLSCGTGAGSTAAALRVLGHADGDVTLDFPGGTLEVALTEKDGAVRDIFLTGPAVTVCEGEFIGA